MTTFVPQLNLLPEGQRQLWESLRPIRGLGFVLYGGTAISLRLGHRISVDFDFFSDRPFDHSSLLEALPIRDHCRVIQEASDTLTVLVELPDVSGPPVKVSFFGALAMGRVGIPEATQDGVLLVASLLDLLATKLKVILQRAEKKDYLDIHALLCHGTALAEGLAAATALYGKAFQPSEALKALAYFGDGNLGELPAGVRTGLIRAAAAIGPLPTLCRLAQGLGAEGE